MKTDLAGSLILAVGSLLAISFCLLASYGAHRAYTVTPSRSLYVYDEPGRSHVNVIIMDGCYYPYTWFVWQDGRIMLTCNCYLDSNETDDLRDSLSKDYSAAYWFCGDDNELVQ
jgi:hypothetical protein